MLESVKIARRQSEIRQTLAALAAKPQPTDDETRQMDALDTEYRGNETRYRAALIAEDTERRDAGADLETRGAREWSALVAGFELRQAALYLDEGRALSGRTAEVVAELRRAGGYRGVPVPWEALERRAGETVAAGVMNPVTTLPVIDRLFAPTVAARMGASFLNAGTGEIEVPVATSAISASWAATETGEVGAPTAYETVDRPLRPHHTLGIQMALTRRAMLQAGESLEAAIRRDLMNTMRGEIDKAVFQGTGADGQPSGLLNMSGLLHQTVNGVPYYATVWVPMLADMIGRAASADLSNVRVLIHPKIFSRLEAGAIGDFAWSEYRKLVGLLVGRFNVETNFFPSPVNISANALPLIAAVGETPERSPGVVSCVTDGVAPFYVATWGAIDLIRDPYSDAKSGGLRLTALATMDVTVSRTEQLVVLDGLQYLPAEPASVT